MLVFYYLNYISALKRREDNVTDNNLQAILRHSLFQDEKDLKAQLSTLEGSETGTKIIIWNLER